MRPEDAAYLLKDPAERERRLALLILPHIKPLADYRVSIMQQGVPNFDPWDGGIGARVLFLLEAPGPQAVKSGFVSCNNPDPTACNLWHLLRDSGIARSDILIWNIVPWYVGAGGTIRPVNREDIQQAMPYLQELLALLPQLERIVLIGRKAQSAETQIRLLTPLPITPTYHMSAQVFNISPEKKRLTQDDFGSVAQCLRSGTQASRK